MLGMDRSEQVKKNYLAGVGSLLSSWNLPAIRVRSSEEDIRDSWREVGWYIRVSANRYADDNNLGSSD